MDKENLIQQLSIAYVLYQNLCDNPISAESFYQEYQEATMQFERLTEKN